MRTGPSAIVANATVSHHSSRGSSYTYEVYDIVSVRYVQRYVERMSEKVADRTIKRSSDIDG